MMGEEGESQLIGCFTLFSLQKYLPNMYPSQRITERYLQRSFLQPFADFQKITKTVSLLLNFKITKYNMIQLSRCRCLSD